MGCSRILDGLDDYALEPVVAVQESGVEDELGRLIRSPDEEKLSISNRCASVLATERPPETTHPGPLLHGPSLPAVVRQLEFCLTDCHQFLESGTIFLDADGVESLVIERPRQ